LILAACEPIKSLDRRPNWEKCKQPAFSEANWRNDPHPLEIIYANELKQEMLESKLVAVFHKNAIKAHDMLLAKNALLKKGFKLHSRNHNIYKLASEGTKFDNIGVKWAESGLETVLVTSKEPNVAELLKLSKKWHNLFLLYGFVEDRLLRKDELVEYSQMPSLDVMRAQLCHTLDNSAQAVSGNIGHHLTALSHNLEQYVKQKSE
jgi:ribosomal protein L10